jgi:hypothetical protein
MPVFRYPQRSFAIVLLALRRDIWVEHHIVYYRLLLVEEKQKGMRLINRKKLEQKITHSDLLT